MQWTDILGLIGGLALFLYGMSIMGEGMELLAGSRLKSILERLTRNRVLAMLVGMLLTAVIQSSNAVTAMTVGFVNAGLMEFTRAIGVIMGANIGTTITGQLIALNVTAYAPIFAFIGVVLFLYFGKSKRLRYIGMVLAGLGILFMGMQMMSSSMRPLQDVQWFRDAMVSFKNPLIGIAVGALFTALIQSSSASIGVLQAMAMQGLIGLESAVYVLCGQNIGCTIAAIMAAIGGNKGAKRTALVHLLFNVTGTVLFVIVCQLTPFISWVEALTPMNGPAQIANAHTIFNIATTLILLPASNVLARIATVLIPGKDDGEDSMRLLHITSTFGAASIGIAQAEAEIGRMEGLARENLRLAVEALFSKATSLEAVHRDEETIDYLNKEITAALIRLNAMELTTDDADHISGMYHVISDIERIGDHAENIAGYAERMREQSRTFSDIASAELAELSAKVFDIIDSAYAHFVDPATGSMAALEALEQSIDDMVDRMQAAHIQRLTDNTCSPDLGMLYVEILTDLERAADHALNIAEAAREPGEES